MFTMQHLPNELNDKCVLTAATNGILHNVFPSITD